MRARDIVLAPIDRREADVLIRAHHYSGKPYPKSRLHLGVLLDGRLLGAMAWGPPLDAWNVVGLVRGTHPDAMVELNRMAFAPELPRNSESRALGIAARLFRQHAPWIEWALSYADERSGTGTIYRAAGWWLTGMRKGQTFWRAPDGRVVSSVGLVSSGGTREAFGLPADGWNRAAWKAAGLTPMTLRQCRYILPLADGVRERLSVPILPYARARVAGTTAPPSQDVRPDPRAPCPQ